jgi:WD40 repeat protein
MNRSVVRAHQEKIMSSRSRGALVFGLLLAWCCAAPSQGEKPVKEKPVRVDAQGDPLPPGVLARLGSVRFQQGGGGAPLVFLDDGKTLLSTGGGVVRYWEVPGGKEKRPPLVLPGHIWDVTRDGRFVAAGVDTAESKTDIEVWDVRQGKRLQVCRGHAQILRAVALSPDGQTLAVAGRDDHTLRIWKVSSGELLHDLKQEKYAPYSLSFSANGQLLAWGDTDPSHDGGSEQRRDDRAIHVFDVTKGKVVQQMKNLEGFPIEAVFSPAAELIADGLGPRLWDLKNPDKPRALQENCANPYERPTFSPDGTRLAVRDDDAIDVWDLGKKAVVARIQLVRPGQRLGPGSLPLAISPDNKLIAVGFSSIRLWRIDTKEELTNHSTVRDGAFQRLEVTADGAIALTQTNEQVIQAWDLRKGKELYRLVIEAEFGRLLPITLSPAGGYFAVGHKPAVELRDLATGKLLRTIPPVKDGLLWDYRPGTFSPDGKLLATAGDRLRFWDVESGKERQVLETKVENPTVVAFSPDGKWLAVHRRPLTSEPKPHEPSRVLREFPVQVFNLRTGKQERELSDSKQCRALVFTAGGDKVMVRTKDLSVWETATGRPLARWERVVPRGEDIEQSQAASPDGRFVVSDDFGLPRLLEVATGEPVRSLSGREGHRGGVAAAAFLDGGRRLATAGTDNTILIWDWLELLALLTAPPDGGAARQRDWWADLESPKAEIGVRAVARLARAPADALPLLRKGLKPVPARDARRVELLVALLEDDDFKKRDAARQELEKLGELAEPELRAALKSPTLDLRKQVEGILGRLDTPACDPGTLRSVRAIQVLEYIGTAEAREVLAALTRGEALARQTKEAQAALNRLERQGSSSPSSPDK